MLRQRLQEISETQDVGQHQGILQKIAADHPHSIHVVESPYPLNRYTCLMHVFGFTEKAEYIAIADYGLGNVYAGAEFAHWLINNDVLEKVAVREANDGDLVMYFRDGAFKHVGLLQPNVRVLSKWGIGHLYEHAILEVPESYGTDVRYYRAMSFEDVFDVFAQFAEEKGIPFENADS